MYVPLPAVGLAVLCAWARVPEDKARRATTARAAENLTEIRILLSLQEDTGRGQRPQSENFRVTVGSALSSAPRPGSALSSGFRPMPRPKGKPWTPERIPVPAAERH